MLNSKMNIQNNPIALNANQCKLYMIFQNKQNRPSMPLCRPNYSDRLKNKIVIIWFLFS